MSNGLSERVMEHFLRPRHARRLACPTGEGWAGSVEANRYMMIQVEASGGCIKAVAFGTAGCAPAIACGSFIAEWATGRTSAEALSFTSDALREALGGLPASRSYCADLAVQALRAAVMASLEKTP